MAEVAKYAPINGGALHTDLKSQLSFLRTKRTVTFAYAFLFVFIAFTVFLAFSPSSNSSAPWFTDIFATTSGGSASSPPSTPIYSDESYRSHFSSIYYYFFPNTSRQVSSSSSPSVNIARSHNTTVESPGLETSNPKQQTRMDHSDDKAQVLETNHTAIAAPPPSKETSGEFLNPNQTRTENLNSTVAANQTANQQPTRFSSSAELKREPSSPKNQTQVESPSDKDEALKPNQSSVAASDHPPVKTSPKGLASGGSNSSENAEKSISEKGVMKNFTSSLSKKQGNGTNKGVTVQGGKRRSENLVELLGKCDLYDGNWVRDESYPLYKPGSCSLIDEQFNCFLNGRPDRDYDKLKWKPKGCSLPRLNASHMLEMLRDKRLVFVGDSLNRNMWESLVCILRNAVKDKRKVYEAFGRHHFRTEASYSFIFEEYKCSVEFFVSPFLVQEWELKDKNGGKKETLRLDLIENFADQYKTADILVFNTGHWWTHDKTSRGKDYYQEGSHVYEELNVLEAFRKALTTWGRWVDANINFKKTIVLFRGYSATHFSGGQWNSGGQCDHETEPIKNEAYLSHYSQKMVVLEKVIRGMRSPVSYMNITRMSDFRKDGHPSIYRKQNVTYEERRSPLRFQDCSHWCLPGVPDVWNEILYVELLRSTLGQIQNEKQQQQQHTSQKSP